MKKFSKQVVAWGEGLIHDYLLDVLKRRRVRSPGDEYSAKKEDNINDKKTHVPEVGLGNPTRDINHKRTPGDVPEMTSGYLEEQELYGDAPADDEEKPGGGRRINPANEPPAPDQKHISLLSDDPVTINNLFHSSTQDRDRKPSPRTKKLLESLYNTTPVRFKHRSFSVDALH
jgi:hypothetical protein